MYTIDRGLSARVPLRMQWRVERLSRGVTRGLDKWQAPASQAVVRLAGTEPGLQGRCIPFSETRKQRKLLSERVSNENSLR